MSVQSDFEHCLEYAQMLEANQEQRNQAQNNIVVILNESERLKSKIRLCITLSIISAAIPIILFAVFINTDMTELLSLFIVASIVFSVSFFNFIKTKTKSTDFEAQKPRLIQQYTISAENCEREISRIIDKIYSENLFDIVPADYFSVAAIDFCITQMRKKIASTATEAFGLLEMEIKHLEQMESLEQINNAQLEELDGIRRAININTLITLTEQNKRRS